MIITALNSVGDTTMNLITLFQFPVQLCLFAFDDIM